MTAHGHVVTQAEDAETPRGPSTRMWLNAGAVTLGVGAAMVAGAAVASADTGTDSGPATGHSASSRPNGHAASSTPAKPRKARSVAVTRNAAATNSPASKVTITAPSTPISRTPSVSARAVVSTTTTATAQPVALATPTPNSIIEGLAEFGNNVYLTVTDQITLAENNLTVLGQDMLTVLGISRETITGSGIYGNPAQNKYYVPMADYVTAPLATVAMAYGQLTSTTPDLPGFTNAALTTNSLVYPGFKILRSVGTQWFVQWTDSYELLQDKNVRVITNTYVSDQQSKAINDLSAGLSDPTKAMIAAIEGPVEGQASPGTKTVVVLGLDTTNDIVTINDPTQTTGQGLEMTLDDFTDAWGEQNFLLTTVQKAASSSTPLPEPATKLVWSLPAPNEIGQALQAGLTNIATLVVHQIQGAQTSLGVLANDLSYTFGITSVDITPPAPENIQYGNYTKNYPYYYFQGAYNSCVLMATAAMIAQLDGGPVPAELGNEIFNLAAKTPSGVKPDQMMFYPEVQTRDVPGKHWGTYYNDALELLGMYGVTPDMTTYTSNQGDLALDALNNALSAEQAVMVAVSTDVLYSAYSRKYFGIGEDPGPSPVSDHAVVVISVDVTKNAVYLNDSAYKNGQGLPIPLDEFMRAWRASNYRLITGKITAT